MGNGRFNAIIWQLQEIAMRAPLKEYEAVQEAAMKFVKSVAEGNSKYARELFIDEAWNAGGDLMKKC